MSLAAEDATLGMSPAGAPEIEGNASMVSGHHSTYSLILASLGVFVVILDTTIANMLPS
jgi:hypothetical protein